MVTHLVVTDNVSLGVPGPVLAEVCVIMVILDPVLEAEGVGLLVLVMAGLVTRGYVSDHRGGVGDNRGRVRWARTDDSSVTQRPD